MTGRARLVGPALLLVVVLLAVLLPTTRATFSGATSVSGAVGSDALVDRLEVDRLDAAARAASTPAASYVEQVRPLGGGLVAGLSAARDADDGGASATVTETGSDRLRVPSNSGFDVDAAGWTSTVGGSLAAGSADHAATGGNPGGALRFAATGSPAGPVTAVVSWSTTFAHTGGTRAVALRHDVRLAGSAGLAAGAVLRAELVAPGGATTVLSRSPLAPGPVAGGLSPWRTATGSAGGGVVTASGNYTLRLTASLSLASGVDKHAEVLVDGVALDVTAALLVPVPANRTFDATTTGWSAQKTGLTSIDAHSPSDGEPAGSMRASVTGGTAAATGTVTWNTTFEHVGGSAGRATLSFSHRILLGHLVTERTGYTVSLIKPGGEQVDLLPFTRMVPVGFPGLDPAWTRRSATVPLSALDETGTYGLSVHTEVYTTTPPAGDTNATGMSIGYDNISLDRVATGQHLDVETVVPVRYRSAARLEWRAATTGDPVAVTVWRDGAWRDVGTITARTLTAASVPLTHRGDGAEAEVRVRFTSQKDASTDDVLSLDWVRVVPDDPPLRPSDTDLVLPAVVAGATAPRLAALVRLRNRGSAALDLTLAADAPVLAWAGFEVATAADGTTCSAGWTDGVALSTHCTLPPGGSVAVAVRVVGGRAPGSWSAALVLSDAARPGFFRAVVPARVDVTA